MQFTNHDRQKRSHQTSQIAPSLQAKANDQQNWIIRLNDTDRCMECDAQESQLLSMTCRSQSNIDGRNCAPHYKPLVRWKNTQQVTNDFLRHASLHNVADKTNPMNECVHWIGSLLAQRSRTADLKSILHPGRIHLLQKLIQYHRISMHSAYSPPVPLHQLVAHPHHLRSPPPC